MTVLNYIVIIINARGIRSLWVLSRSAKQKLEAIEEREGERGTGEKDVHDAAHALANISPYEDINQRLSWTPMLAITYA